ncbi:hypothetical protein SNE40_012784 [Patella caerulea]|uniref:Profilin n=1 Tax=Patella caerulea TaxID=87958 RepID=A0AAN8JID1_PATCE
MSTATLKPQTHSDGEIHSSSNQNNSNKDKGPTFDTEEERMKYILSVWKQFKIKFMKDSKQGLGAAIYHIDNNAVLTCSEELSITEKDFIDILAKTENPELAYEKGITIQEKHFKVVIADGRYGIYSTRASEDCSICKTDTLIILWIHPKCDKNVKSNEELMKLGDCFRSWGF